jgi:hypothetical protein
MHIGPPSEMPSSAARREPAASITARTSSMRCSSVGRLFSSTRSESPVPRLSNTMSREKRARRCRKFAKEGSVQNSSMLDTQPMTNTRSIGPSPITW